MHSVFVVSHDRALQTGVSHDRVPCFGHLIEGFTRGGAKLRRHVDSILDVVITICVVAVEYIDPCQTPFSCMNLLSACPY